ncbi:MAG: alanine racemase [Peptoniphilus sp.]|nr:alanine racemase [Peptoniphilus sp.]MDD7363368.1 alanine racemase [Bacillota bacterium]MDY6044287.1 alanine racemase [Peptoniphilus sp.]
MLITRPAWLEVDLDKVKHNMEVIQSHLKDHTDVISIVKADAYSFGAIEIAKVMIDCGVTHFAVASGNEGMALRRALPDVDILVLGYTPEEVADVMIDNSIDMALYRLDVAKKLDDLAARMGKKAGVHIAIDSGMNRIGFKPTEESIDAIEAIYKMDHIEIKGMFTHFAKADDDREFTIKQYERYDWVVQELAKRDIHLKRHVSNSHAIINFRDFDLDYVRPGIIQYGTVEGDPAGKDFGVRFVAELKAKIGHVKTIGPGEGISYGQIYTTDRETQVVTLPIGYADGMERSMSEKFDVLIGGKRCPQIGRICMDQMMVDATGVDCKVGDEVVIIGKQGKEEITIEEIAKANDEIPTSFITHFKKRLPKVYLKGGKRYKTVDEILGVNY